VRESSSEAHDARFYTLLWDSCDILGFEEKQARARLWRRSLRDGRSTSAEALPAVLDDSDMVYLTFDYMDTFKNIGSGVVQILGCTAKRPRSSLGRHVAAALGLSPPDALVEPEWEGETDWSLKQHFIEKFGMVWLVLRNLFFGEHPDFAIPAPWREQLIATASKRTHLAPEIVTKALQPLSTSQLGSEGVVKMLAVGISHGASLAQCFHLYYNNAQKLYRARQVEKSLRLSGLALNSVHFGAYRWTDGGGMHVFCELTGCKETETEVMLPSVAEEGRESFAASDSPSTARSTVRETSVVLAQVGDAVAISLQADGAKNVVDPIPRIDWRCGLIFARRGYVNVVNPVGLVAGSGEVVTLQARAQQRRRLFGGVAPSRVKYHMAGNYKTATAYLTSTYQRRQDAKRKTRDRNSDGAKINWGNVKATLKNRVVSIIEPSKKNQAAENAVPVPVPVPVPMPVQVVVAAASVAQEPVTTEPQEEPTASAGGA